MFKKISIFFTVFLIIIGTLLSGAYVYVKKNIYEENITTSKVVNERNNTKSEELEYQEVEGITNVLLIGSDEREEDEFASRADSIIIATLDNNNKNVKLTSLYRDTLVYIPGYGEEKINSAYQLGGISLLLDTIKENYNIPIENYITINFNGFEEIIDEIGGIEIDIKENLIAELNKYIGESTGGNDCPINESGNQLLNGKQTLAYSRIRYNCGDDYERAERQREVLSKIAEKIKDTSPVRYLSIMNVILQYVKTNIDPLEALNMAYTIYSFNKLDIKQISIPVIELTKDINYKNLGSVLITDLEQNADILNRFIYENEMPDESTFIYNKILSLIEEYETTEESYVDYYDSYDYIDDYDNYYNYYDYYDEPSDGYTNEYEEEHFYTNEYEEEAGYELYNYESDYNYFE